jgi:hypothetical protein
MKATILEALMNAHINLTVNRDNRVAYLVGENQLKNAIALLSKGYSADDDVEAIIQKYDSVEKAPRKEKA